MFRHYANAFRQSRRRAPSATKAGCCGRLRCLADVAQDCKGASVTIQQVTSTPGPIQTAACRLAQRCRLNNLRTQFCSSRWLELVFSLVLSSRSAVLRDPAPKCLEFEVQQQGDGYRILQRLLRRVADHDRCRLAR